jgi:hypothetical protein
MRKEIRIEIPLLINMLFAAAEGALLRAEMCLNKSEPLEIEVSRSFLKVLFRLIEDHPDEEVSKHYLLQIDRLIERKKEEEGHGKDA